LTLAGLAATGLTGVGFAWVALTAAGFAPAGFAGAGFAAAGFGIGLFGFTVTFDVAMGVCLSSGRAAFFGAAALWPAFPGVALPGFLAALVGFFEGIYRLRLFMKSARLYRRATACTGRRHNIF
jgi:hypothetical protein